MSREDLPVDGTIDAGLFLLELATPPGVERSQKEIAEVCGCSMQNIQRIEYIALRKLRAELEKRGITAEHIL